MAVFQTMERQMVEQVALYTQRPPSGEPLPINIAPILIPDGVSTDLEVRDAVCNLSNGRSGSTSNMHGEHIKEWLRGIQRKEDPQQNEDNHSTGNLWHLLMRLVTAVWETSMVPQQLSWIIVVLIPKGRGNYQGLAC
jgi:hypothetical protein